MKFKKNFMLLLILLATTFTSVGVFQVKIVQAENMTVKNGDKFVYLNKQINEYFSEELFFPDTNKEMYAYHNFHYSNTERESLRAYNITNANYSSNELEVLEVQTGSDRTKEYMKDMDGILKMNSTFNYKSISLRKERMKCILKRLTNGETAII